MKDRIYNFSAGPSTLPLEVLESVASSLTNYKGTGMSVMEMSHRTPVFEKIIQDAEDNLKRLMHIPEGYKVLFLQGGATMQFSAVPINLMQNSKKADYIITGSWADKAYKEATKYGDVRIVASSKEDNYAYVPKTTRSDFREDADYVHFTHNNTIYGTKFPEIPDVGDITLVTDMSSSILSENIDVSKFGIIYAGAQKNLGPAGVTVVIIKESLVGMAPKNTPVLLDYNTEIDKDSMYNTPPTFAIYVLGEVLKYVIDKGGVEAIEKINKKKAAMLYEYIDNSKMFKAPARVEDRSIMNVVFVTGDDDLDKKFVVEAKEAGLAELNGHRSIGGMRASIYNAMPLEGVEALVTFMEKFEKNNEAK